MISPICSLLPFKINNFIVNHPVSIIFNLIALKLAKSQPGMGDRGAMSMEINLLAFQLLK